MNSDVSRSLWRVVVVLILYVDFTQSNVESLTVLPGYRAGSESIIADYGNGNEGLYGYHAKRPRHSLITSVYRVAEKETAGDVDEYDQYVALPKRAALLLDRIMTALRNAVEDKTQNVSFKQQHREVDNGSKALQRRHGGQDPGQLYWKCYFNPVTCF